MTPRTTIRSVVSWALARPWWFAILAGATYYAAIVEENPVRHGRVSTVSISQVQPELGHAYIGKLSDPTLTSHESPSSALLIDCAEEPPLQPLEPWLGDTHVFKYLSAKLPSSFPDLVRRVCTTLATGNMQHQTIRDTGKGAFSVWHGYVYFSARDNSDPRFNGHSYELVIPDAPRATRATVFRWLAAALLLPLAVLLLRYTASLYATASRRSAVFRNAVPASAMTIVVVLVFAGLVELYLRATIPFFPSGFPTVFDPRIGLVFAPGTVIRHTNGRDFWTTTTANSLGFLDREPTLPKPAGTFRTLLLGDSFVEAAQVDVDEKAQVVLERLLNERLGPTRKFDTVAMGYSGMGQANELALCETFGSTLAPDLIVLVFVFNDFANNSALLEAVRHGWDPLHPARLFFAVGTGGAITRVGPDPSWAERLLPVPRNQAVPQLVASRVAVLRLTPEYAERFGDWHPPDDLDEDTMFYAAQLPPAFDDALKTTDHAIGELANCAKSLGAGLLIAKTRHDGAPAGGGPRGVDPGAATARLMAIADARAIPVLDLGVAFSEHGDPLDAIFPSDGHWNTTGHEWVADAIASYVVAHPKLLSR